MKDVLESLSGQPFGSLFSANFVASMLAWLLAKVYCELFGMEIRFKKIGN